MNTTIAEQLDRIINDTLSLAEQANTSLTLPYEADWPSACYLQQGKEGQSVAWKPVLQQPVGNFAALADALDLELNAQFCAFFTRYYSQPLLTDAPQGQCELLQVWNPEDFERLQENLIGHVLMKRRLKQAPTLFFALTDEDDLILSVDNDSGEVVLEYVGQPPHKVVAPSLAEFLATLTAKLPD